MDTKTIETFPNAAPVVFSKPPQHNASFPLSRIDLPSASPLELFSSFHVIIDELNKRTKNIAIVKTNFSKETTGATPTRLLPQCSITKEFIDTVSSALTHLNLLTTLSRKDSSCTISLSFEVRCNALERQLKDCTAIINAFVTFQNGFYRAPYKDFSDNEIEDICKNIAVELNRSFKDIFRTTNEISSEVARLTELSLSSQADGSTHGISLDIPFPQRRLDTDLRSLTQKVIAALRCKGPADFASGFPDHSLEGTNILTLISLWPTIGRDTSQASLLSPMRVFVDRLRELVQDEKTFREFKAQALTNNTTFLSSWAETPRSLALLQRLDDQSWQESVFTSMQRQFRINAALEAGENLLTALLHKR